MTVLEFIQLVEHMRVAQKKYFKSKAYTIEKQQALEESKKLEKQVDNALLQHRKNVEEKAKKIQQELFEGV